jgi:hypothetical protein
MIKPGSFVTNIIEPNDVDCVLLLPRGKRGARRAVNQLRGIVPFLHIALVEQAEFDEFVHHTFARNRRGELKGMIEVIQ